jgi:hypothetical protein
MNLRGEQRELNPQRPESQPGLAANGYLLTMLLEPGFMSQTRMALPRLGQHLLLRHADQRLWSL